SVLCSWRATGGPGWPSRTDPPARWCATSGRYGELVHVYIKASRQVVLCPADTSNQAHLTALALAAEGHLAPMSRFASCQVRSSKAVMSVASRRRGSSRDA